jgi:hypothetical protein
MEVPVKRRLYFGHVLVFVISSAFLLQTPAAASSDRDGWVSEKLDVQRAFVADMLSCEDDLRGKLPAEWQDSELQAYFSAALWNVYLGVLAYKYTYWQLPASAEDLTSEGFVTHWPANPCSSWGPMALRGPEEGFSAGDLTLQVCPPEFYSKLHDPRPLSFEISVAGPDPAFAALGDAEPIEQNSWAIVPEGALYMLGGYTTPVIKQREKLDAKAQEGEVVSPAERDE